MEEEGASAASAASASASAASDPPKTTTQVRVRPATLDDLAFLVAANLGLAEETEGIALDRALLEQGITMAISDESKGARYLVLEIDDSEVVACLMLTSEWSDWRASNVLWIQSVYVDKAHRRKGYFRMLYEAAKRHAEQVGAAGLRLYAEVENEPAIATYVKLGMKKDRYIVLEDLFTEY